MYIFDVRHVLLIFYFRFIVNTTSSLKHVAISISWIIEQSHPLYSWIRFCWTNKRRKSSMYTCETSVRIINECRSFLDRWIQMNQIRRFIFAVNVREHSKISIIFVNISFKNMVNSVLMFDNVIFVPMQPYWNPNMIVIL
jgi:hypothetical protein